MSFAVQIHDERIVLTQSDIYQVEIFPFGALLNRFAVRQRDGQWCNIIAAFDSVSDAREHLTEWFCSAKLSPFVCRLAQGKYTFSGSTYHVNKHQIGKHTIHGLLYDADFRVIHQHVDAQRASVQLNHVYHHENSGYPFDYQVNITYTLSENGVLTVQTQVQNIGTDTLPLADGWHTYFALDGALENWTLQVRSREQLVFDAEMLPTGERVVNEDFVHATALGKSQWDNCFVLNDDFSHPAAQLCSEHVALRIMPNQAYPFLQVFTPPHHQSIALENLSGAPDCFNNGMGLLLLGAGETRLFRTAYQLSLMD